MPSRSHPGYRNPNDPLGPVRVNDRIIETFLGETSLGSVGGVCAGRGWRDARDGPTLKRGTLVAGRPFLGPDLWSMRNGQAFHTPGEGVLRGLGPA